VIEKKTLEQFAEIYGREKIEQLEASLAAEQAKVAALVAAKKFTISTSKTSHLKFALMSDLHFGSLYYNAPALEAFYNVLLKRGVRELFMSGDLVEGHSMYAGQAFEVQELGLDAQLTAFENDCPHADEISVKFVTGNHDESYKKRMGANVGKMITRIRSDWEFLGPHQAIHKFKTPDGDYSLMLQHPGGGSAYALSYRPQKIVESLMGGQKPNMIAIGHFHKAEFLPSYRNVSVIQSGTFQKQTPFMLGKGLQAHLGGWIVEVEVGKQHNQIKAEFIAFYH